jgi:hypothetical protein
VNVVASETDTMFRESFRPYRIELCTSSEWIGEECPPPYHTFTLHFCSRDLHGTRARASNSSPAEREASVALFQSTIASIDDLDQRRVSVSTCNASREAFSSQKFDSNDIGIRTNISICLSPDLFTDRYRALHLPRIWIPSSRICSI